MFLHLVPWNHLVWESLAQHYIGQLESLRVSDIAQPIKKKKTSFDLSLGCFIWQDSYEFWGTQALRKIETSWIYVNLTLHLFEHELSQFFNYELNNFLCLNDVSVMFILLNLLMMYEPCFCIEVIVCQQHNALQCLWVSFL
jgi:hypothetical protein